MSGAQQVILNRLAVTRPQQGLGSFSDDSGSFCG